MVCILLKRIKICDCVLPERFGNFREIVCIVLLAGTCVYDNDFFVEIVSLKCIVCMYARVTVRKHENNIFVLSFMCVYVL